MDDKIVPVAGILGDDDNARIVVGKVVPDPVPRRMVPRHPSPDDLKFSDDVNHPSPHARRDKTEEWDMRRQGHPMPATENAGHVAGQFSEPVNAVARSSKTLVERIGGIAKPHARPTVALHPEDEVEREGDDFEYEARDGRNLDELAEHLAQSEMLSDIGGLTRKGEPSLSDAARAIAAHNAREMANGEWPTFDPKEGEGLGEGADGGGKRMNAGKNRMELTLPEWDWALGDVSTKGSYKYDEWNWLLGMKWSTMIGCMKRHIAKFELGERYDGKGYDKKAGTTGCHHLAMVAWNALALMTYDIRELGTDDRATLVQATKLLARINAETSDMKVDPVEALRRMSVGEDV